VHYRVLQEVALISVMERTKLAGWAQEGGCSGTPNRFEVDFPDGHTEIILKATDKVVPAGSRLRIYCGGGGGYGLPEMRAREAVQRDLLTGMISVEHARQYYPHALSAAAEGLPPIMRKASFRILEKQ
jgi:N-methylhydantoinase B